MGIVEREQYAAEMLRAKGLPAGSFEQLAGCPEESQRCLVPSNKRLLELKRAYQLFGCPAGGSYVWREEYIAADLPLSAFRDDCALMWQRRENSATNYILSAESLLKGKYCDLFLMLHEDGRFGVQVVRMANNVMVSRDRIDSTLEIAFLDECFHIRDCRPFVVLDIGAGYGRLGYRMVQAFDHPEVICTDAVAESTFLCEHYLQMRSATPRARAVPLTEIATALEESKVNVAVNIHSFSECSVRAIEWWLGMIRGRVVPYLLIVPNASWHEGQQLSCFGDARARIDMLGVIERAGYRRVACVPKYQDPCLQKYGGVSPTFYHLFELTG